MRRRAARPWAFASRLASALAPFQIGAAKSLLLGARALILFCPLLEPGGVRSTQQLAGFDPLARIAQRRPLPEALGQLADEEKLLGAVVGSQALKGGTLLGARLAIGKLEVERVVKQRPERQQRPALGVSGRAISFEGDLDCSSRRLGKALDPPAPFPVAQVLA